MFLPYECCDTEYDMLRKILYNQTQQNPPVPPPPSFVPSDLAGLVVWFEADFQAFSDAGVTPAGNGDPVQQWNDRSGNAYDAAQAAAGQRPIFRANEHNGKPAIQGDQIDDVLVTPVVNHGIGAADDFIWMAVVKPASVGNAWRSIMTLASGNGSGLYQSNGNDGKFAGYNQGNRIFDTTLAVGTMYLVEMTRASGLTVGTINAVQEATTYPGDVGVPTTSELGLCGGSASDCKVFGGVLYKATPSALNMANLRTYWNNKYAIY